MNLLIYLVSAALLGALVRVWRRQPSWRWIGLYTLAAGGFFAAPLVSSWLQVPTDIIYLARPRSATVDPTFRPRNPLLVDVPLQFLPFRSLVRNRFATAALPLWANELGTGQPLLGNAQAAPFSPLTLLTLPLAPPDGLAVTTALKLLLSLLLTDALLSALGASRAGAVFGAAAYTLSPFSICWAFHPVGLAMAWVPGVLLAVLAVSRRERGGLAALVACTCGLALSGHPETLAHTALVVGIVVAVLLGRHPAAQRRRFVLDLATCGLLVAGLTAPVLLPVLEAIPASIRSGASLARPDLYQPVKFTPSELQLVVNPLAFGSARDRTWRGPDNFNETATGSAGVLALALALAAAVGRRGRAAVVFAAGLVALALAFGFPPLLRLLTWLPPFGQAMNGRLRMFWVLALALAAGLGLQDLAVSRRARLVAAGAVGLVTAGLALLPPPGVGLPRQWWAVALGGCVVMIGGLLAPEIVGRKSNRVQAGSEADSFAAGLPWLAVGCLTLDLALLNTGFLPVLPRAFDLTALPPIPQLQQAQAAHPTEPFRVLADDQGLVANLPAYFGLWGVRVEDPMAPARPTVVVVVGLSPRSAAPARALQPAFAPAFLDYFAVRYLYSPPGVLRAFPWQEVWRGASGSLWRNLHALPLFFVPASAQRASNASEAMAATLANPDFAQWAVFEGPENLSGKQRGSAVLLRLSANEFELDAQSASRALLVSSVSFDPGWQAWIDGTDASPRRVNAAFLGLVLPPGAHRVAFAFRPAGWRWGLHCFALTLAIIGTAGAVRWRRQVGASAVPRRPVREQ